ncbi:phosphoribosylanthranilate isomerase [archaeon]|nr:phosphoribosylanthranilate isomerase [archaeon]
MKVKICGHKTVEDAKKSVELGADFIGVIVEVPVDTPRKISREKAAEIVRAIEPPAQGVMVIMPGTIDEAIELYEAVKAPFIQLHGNESPDFVKELKSRAPCKIIKAIHVKEGSVELAKEHAKFADILLLDTPTEKAGGSGITHDWRLSKRIIDGVEIPVLLAGGLNPENVEEAIKATQPYGVDTASGVEDSFGMKDYDKVKNFIKKAKGA